MKRFFALLFSLIIVVSFSACASGSGNDSNSTASSGGNASGNIGTNEKILVAYFSASGNTKKIAEYIAEATGGILFELVPVKPYTSADLNWTNADSRVTREHEDETLRDIPLEKATPDNFSEYDVVFIGYPIWWGIAAWPVNNFVKNNDFSGKTVIPFATSVSSGMGQSGVLLRKIKDTGNWLDGQRFPSAASKSTVETWVKGLNSAA